MARALGTSASVLLEIGFSGEVAHLCFSGSRDDARTALAIVERTGGAGNHHHYILGSGAM